MKAFKFGIKAAALAGLTALISVSAMAGIQGSKHDMTPNEGAMGIATGTAEICVFCHTPHGGTTAGGGPLWNRVALNTQTPYQSATLDGTIEMAGSPSLACLSCHDGSQAMNTVINAPSTKADGYNYVSTGDLMGTTSVFIPSTVAALGLDMNNDHPVSLPYAGGGITTVVDSGIVTVGTLADPQFKTDKLNAETLGGGTAWWIDSGVAGDTAGTRQKSDLILYARNNTDVGYVECATCHDPHDAAAVSFLRMTNNSNSQVCLACHDK